MLHTRALLKRPCTAKGPLLVQEERVVIATQVIQLGSGSLEGARAKQPLPVPLVLLLLLSLVLVFLVLLNVPWTSLGHSLDVLWTSLGRPLGRRTCALGRPNTSLCKTIRFLW